MKSVSARLLETNGRPAGFDYMRIGLALFIVCWHTVATSYGGQAQLDLVTGITRPIWSIILPLFFALSGFLVSGSLERSQTLVSFLGLRVIRLAPALAVESAIAMLILGPIFTSLPLRSYFQHPQFFAYALNMVGDVHFSLPGVFTGNPTPDIVNGQLWTLPYELECYAVIAIFAMAGAYRIKSLLAVGCALFQLYMIHVALSPHVDNGLVTGRMLVMTFLYGALLYRFRDHLPWTRWLGIGGAIVTAVLLYRWETAQLASLPAAYLTVYLGLQHPPRIKFISSGDYTYGIFLYGYPIQQSVSAMLGPHVTWYYNLLLAGPVIVTVAYLSWHFVEKPALSLREPLKRIERAWLPVAGRISRIAERCMPAALRVRWAAGR